MSTSLPVLGATRGMASTASSESDPSVAADFSAMVAPWFSCEMDADLPATPAARTVTVVNDAEAPLTTAEVEAAGSRLQAFMRCRALAAGEDPQAAPPVFEAALEAAKNMLAQPEFQDVLLAYVSRAFDLRRIDSRPSSSYPALEPPPPIDEAGGHALVRVNASNVESAAAATVDGHATAATVDGPAVSATVDEPAAAATVDEPAAAATVDEPATAATVNEPAAAAAVKEPAVAATVDEPAAAARSPSPAASQPSRPAGAQPPQLSLYLKLLADSLIDYGERMVHAAQRLGAVPNGLRDFGVDRLIPGVAGVFGAHLTAVKVSGDGLRAFGRGMHSVAGWLLRRRSAEVAKGGVVGGGGGGGGGDHRITAKLRAAGGGGGHPGCGPRLGCSTEQARMEQAVDLIAVLIAVLFCLVRVARLRQ